MPKPQPSREPDPMAGVVDRLLAQLPGLQGQPEPPRAVTRSPAYSSTVVVGTHSNSATPGDVVGVWMRLLLGLALGIMLAGWPYLRTCGLPLFQYLAAVGTVTWAGAWAAMAAWKYRVPLAHVVSLIVVLYGLMLGAAELLPRTGYAVDRATWQCEETAAPSTVTARRNSRSSQPS